MIDFLPLGSRPGRLLIANEIAPPQVFLEVVGGLLPAYLVSGRVEKPGRVAASDGYAADATRCAHEWATVASRVLHALRSHCFGLLRPGVRPKDALGLCVGQRSVRCVGSANLVALAFAQLEYIEAEPMGWPLGVEHIRHGLFLHTS
jgi:hypothetical protein